MRLPPVGRSALGAAAVLVAASCGQGGGASVESESTPVPTVAGVGFLPGSIPTTTLDPNADPSAIVPDVAVSRPVDEDGVVEEQVAELVAGNRVIALGDSILASTASRFGGELCDELESGGWAVEVNAEPGRFVEFGNRVLDRRLPAEEGGDDDWDAAIVHLGSNYGLDQDSYRDELDEILSRLAPRPTLLLTVTVYRPAWAEVNEVIDEMADTYDNVIVVDWERTARTPGVLSRDGLHPGDAGEEVLVELISAALGDLPGAEADCLRSQFTDDSQIGLGSGGSSSGGSSSGGTSSGGSSSSSGGSSGSTSSGTSGGTTGSTTGVTTTTLVGVTTGGTDGGTTGGTDTTDGGTTDGTTDGGTTDGTTDGGTTDGGSTDGTSTDGGTTDGGSTDGGTTDGGSTDGTSTDGGTADGGTTDGSSTTGGSTGSGTTDGTSTDGGTTDGGTADGSTSTTTGGATTGGTTGGTSTDTTSTTGGTTGGTTDTTGGTTDTTGGTTDS